VLFAESPDQHGSDRLRAVSKELRIFGGTESPRDAVGVEEYYVTVL
jgi:hypothetical protein